MSRDVEQETTGSEVAPFVSLSIDQGGDEDNLEDELPSESLEKRMIDIINGAPNRTVRPALVASKLGISVNDACAELCGLLSAVGGGPGGASFTFEKIGSQDVMSFQFPRDFERLAFRKRRTEDIWVAARRAVAIGIRVLKIVTAFGLILSLLILSIAAIIGLVTIFVGLSRADNGRGGRHEALLMNQIRSICFTIRQILWFLAVFGPTPEGQEPFLRDIAYDLSLVLSCCCGNPGSVFYWIRARQLARRRHQAMRRWGRATYMDSEVEGVTIVRQGSWGAEIDAGSSSPSQEGQRGLLSVAVEFLFGPEPASPDNPLQAWKLRAAVIVKNSNHNEGIGMSLREFAPYIDYPPALHDGGGAAIVEQGLVIVAHFNGIPIEANGAKDMTEARFLFPELLAESAVSTQYDCIVPNDDGGWGDFLYVSEGRASRLESNTLPEFLCENRYRFTALSSIQLMHCTALGLLNFAGVVWLGQAVGKGGLLQLAPDSTIEWFLSYCLLPILRGYASLFLVIPTARLFILVFLNSRRKERNTRRQSLREQGPS